MSRALQQMFTGYLFIFLDIHVLIDILPNPIGYLLIASGLHKMKDAKHTARKASIAAYGMAVLSIPTLIQSDSYIQSLQSTSIGWQLYSMGESIGHLILMYFVFHTLYEEASFSYNAQMIQNRIGKLGIIYMTVALSCAFIQPFFLNVSTNSLIGWKVGSIMLMIIVHVAFLVHLYRLKQSYQIYEKQELIEHH